MGSETTFRAEEYAICFGILALIDVVLRSSGVMEGAHWFAMHALANFGIAYLTFGSVARVFSDPEHALYKDIGDSDEDWSNAAMLGTLHVYHLVRYTKLSAADLFHHLAFIPFNQLAVHWPHISTSMGGAWKVWGKKWGPLVNAQHFFVCGLPGALDYLCLALVKQGLLGKLRHKHLQAKINVWMRAPGILATVAIHLFELNRAWSREPDRIPFSAILIGIVNVALIGWNALYYMERVVAATWRHQAGTGKMEPEMICGSSGRPKVVVGRSNWFAPMQVEWDDTKPIKVS